MSKKQQTSFDCKVRIAALFHCRHDVDDMDEIEEWISDLQSVMSEWRRAVKRENRMRANIRKSLNVAA